MDRRSFLVTVSSALGLGVAGCSDGGQGNTGEGANTGVPATSFERSFTFGESSSLVSITHPGASFIEIVINAGDPVYTDNLLIRGENLAYPDGSSAISGIVPLLSASTAAPQLQLDPEDSFKVNLDGSQEPRAAELDIIWSSEDGEDSALIYVTSGPDA